MSRFRGLIASASLKRCGHQHLGVQRGAFPRLDCLGLIEAAPFRPASRTQRPVSEA